MKDGKIGNRGDMQKYTRGGDFSRLTFSKKRKKSDFRYGLGEHVYQISGLFLFSLWPKAAVQTDKQTLRHTYLQVKIGISSAGCSSHVDFDNLGMLL